MEKLISLLTQFEHSTKKDLSSIENFKSYMLLYYEIEYYDISSLNIDTLIKECYKLLDPDNTIFTIYLYSYIFYITKSNIYAEELINYVNTPTMPYEIKVFVKKQLDSKFFNYPESACDLPTNTYFLKSIVSDIVNELPPSLLTPIPYNERNHDFVIVLTSQLLSLDHGPTKHTLDHCVSIIQGLKKNVLLINTAEISGRPDLGLVFSNQVSFNYINEFSKYEYITFNDIEIPFFQCNNDMPNLETIELLLNYIRALKPEFVLEIGSGSFTAGIVDSIIPVLTNGTMHAQIECSATRYQTLARELTETDRIFLKNCNLKEENIIYSMFTSSLKPQTLNLSRSDLHLPSDSFAIALVGNRLGNEITQTLFNEFCKTIEINPKIYYIFFGSFNSFTDRLNSAKDSQKKHFIYYGTTTDTISCLENCDLYINPPRIGGGMSSIEALAMGLPAVSLLQGDGGIVLGKDFSVNSISEFSNKIIEYSTDSHYYKIQSDKAKKRGKYLQDSNKVFCDTVREFINIISEF